MQTIIVIALGIILGLGTDYLLTRVFKIPQRVKNPNAVKKEERELLQKFTSRINAIAPESAESKDKARASLRKAGLRMSTQKLWAIRIICLCIGIVIGLFIFSMMTNKLHGAASFILCCILGFFAPQFYIWDARKKWRSAIEQQLPDAIDMMCISISAGATFDASIKIVAERMKGLLAKEFRNVVADSRYSSIMASLTRFSEDAEVPMLTNMVAAVSSAEASGAPIVTSLEEQAKLARDMRRLHVETEASKLDTKLVFPLGFLALPAYMLLLLAPFVAQIAAQLFPSLS